MRRLLLAFALLGCEARGPVMMRYVGSDQGLAVATLAAKTWNETCAAELIDVSRDGGDVELRESEGMWGGEAFGVTQSRREVLGLVGPEKPQAIAFMVGSHALPTLAHEFGHAQGLGHQSAGVMRQGVDYDALDPSTAYSTLLPGTIRDEDCRRARGDL